MGDTVGPTTHSLPIGMIAVVEGRKSVREQNLITQVIINGPGLFSHN